MDNLIATQKKASQFSLEGNYNQNQMDVRRRFRGL